MKVSGRQLGLVLERLAPVVASFLDRSLGLQRVPQVQQGFGEVGPLGERFMIQLDRVIQLAGLL